MQGIQHLFRQHALEKQASTDSWHSAQSAVTNQAHLQQHYTNAQNHVHSLGDGDAKALDNDDDDGGEFNQGKRGQCECNLITDNNNIPLPSSLATPPDEVLNRLVSSPPQAVPDANKLFHRPGPQAPPSKRRSGGHNGGGGGSSANNGGNYVRETI